MGDAKKLCDYCGQDGHSVANCGRKNYQGPRFAPEEAEMGNVGIRWVTETRVGGRPTLHDVLDYIERRGEAITCTCQRCRAFVFPTPKSL